jgi:large subunit ribosomal protein L10
MPNEHKINVVKDTSEKLKNSNGVYFTRYTGIDVQTITELRKSFRDNNVDFSVTKNTLTKLAAKEAGYEGLFDDILSGQIGIAYSADPTAPAKVIKEFKKENKELLEVLGLMFEGELYSSEKYKEFADLPTKEESLAKMVMMFNQPMTKLVSTLNGSFGKLLSVLNSLKDTKS